MRIAPPAGVGGGSFDTAERYLSRADDALSAPRQIIDRLDTAWQNRSNQISGAMDRFGSCGASRQRLASETGGSGDLFARMQQNRERALLARKEQQWQERRD